MLTAYLGNIKKKNHGVIADNIYKLTEGSPPIETPFGTKYIIGADIMASGYIFKPVENVMNIIHRYYANTHSNAHNGKMMSKCIEWSKNIIRKEINANQNDQIIFTGNGCSGAVIHLIHALDLPKYQMDVVVFISVAEHHSNHLPWTHTCAKVEIVPIDKNGAVDMKWLKNKLKFYNDNKYMIIGSFNAGSNVTGTMQNCGELSVLIHSYGGLAIFDFAGSGPYTDINMHTNDSIGNYYDAVMISPHKFLGGPGSPGLLVARSELFSNEVPFGPCGGTVRFVCKSFKKYCNSIETRETGGTPNILGSIKVGLAFRVKRELREFILYREREILNIIEPGMKKLESKGFVKLLFPCGIKDRLPVFSFIVPGYHYNLIVILLNDLFGVQSRGGVSCCGMLAESLLGMHDCDNNRVFKSILSDTGVPSDYGWVRLSIHYSTPDVQIEYIMMSVDFIVRNIAALEKKYEYDPASNNWTHIKWNTPYDKIPNMDDLSNLDTMSVYGQDTKYLTKKDLVKQFSDTLYFFEKK